MLTHFVSCVLQPETYVDDEKQSIHVNQQAGSHICNTSRYVCLKLITAVYCYSYVYDQ